jgi:surface antigen
MATQAQAKQWILASVGKGYDTDGYYGRQCKDYANAYANFHGHPLQPSNANATWTIAQDPFWQKLANTPTFLPQVGDIVVWGAWTGNPYGHIGVVLDANLNTFRSVDQNWFNANSTTGSPAAIVSHNYTNPRVVGFLRPTYSAAAQGEEMIANADQAIKIYKMLRPNGGGSQGEIDGTAGKRTFANFLNDAQAEINARDASLRNQNARLAELQAQVNELSTRPTKAEVEALKQQVADAQVLAEKEKAETERLLRERSADSKQLDDASGFIKGLVDFIKGLLKRGEK